MMGEQGMHNSSKFTQKDKVSKIDYSGVYESICRNHSTKSNFFSGLSLIFPYLPIDNNGHQDKTPLMRPATVSFFDIA